MPKTRRISLAKIATVFAVTLATCGTAIRIPLPLNAAGSAARAKRARRIENIYEVAARSRIADTSIGAGDSSTGRKFRHLRPSIHLSSSVASAGHFSLGRLTPFILDGTPQTLALRC
jgi:hypothetical protein